MRRLGASHLLVVGVAAGVLLQAAQPSRPRVYVPVSASTLIADGLASPAPSGAALSGFRDVPAPSLRNAPNTTGYAQVTLAPWVESNGWRFQRGVSRAHYRVLPRGAAGLAAAEAFAFNVDAILNPDPADVPDLGRVLRFLDAHAQPPLPPLANIGVVDDGSDAMGEVLTMLTRRNLLYRIVPAPERALDFTVQLGTREFPREAAANPSDFAARVREKIGDDRRLVRLFGTTTVIARLTADARRGRLVLLSYSRNGQQQDVRVRLLGRWRSPRVAAYGAPTDAAAADPQQVAGATEFTIAAFTTIAIVDLARQ